MSRLLPLTLLLFVAGTFAACDSGFGGSANGNQAPETNLSVRVTDLRETLGDGTLTSTVEASWDGTDPDGVVASYEFRYYDVARDGQVGAEEGWVSTTARDSTILLPIPAGASTAAVVFEVRAVDNEGAKDASPARTVFPIRNSPPSFSLLSAEAPGDTTWPVVSFGWRVEDPEGPTNLAGVEVGINDSTSFVRIPGNVDFATFVAEDPRASGTTNARVYIGRAFQATDVVIPGLRLDAPNVLYFRSVDVTDTTSAVVRFPADPSQSLYVRGVHSDVLVVNDYRATGDGRVVEFAREALRRYGASTPDVWDLSATPQTAGNPIYSDVLPAQADPTLRQTLALWRNIYWVSNSATNRTAGNNLPLAASVMDRFFDGGGKLFVQVPVTLPLTADPAENQGNAALNLLPIAALPNLPPLSTLRLLVNSAVEPLQPVPNTGQTLPPLRAAATVTNALPYEVGPDDVPLYRVPFTVPSTGQPYTGSTVVASMRSDGRVALFALPPVNTTSGALQFVPATAGGDDHYVAVDRILQGLGFPRAGGRPGFARLVRH